VVGEGGGGGGGHGDEEEDEEGEEGGQLEKRKERWDVEEAKGITGKLFLCSGASLFATATRTAGRGPRRCLTCRATAGDERGFLIFLGFFSRQLRSILYFSH
jgi:hypothetical protein